MNRRVPANQQAIIIREGVPADEPFFERLYFETRRDEFAPLGWDAEQLGGILKMQFEMQTRGYKMQFPDARISVIEAGGAAVGRLIATGEIRLVDIAVLPEDRRRGIGSFVLNHLLDEARKSGKTVTLQVLKTNAGAIRLYEKFGFEATRESDLYLTMRRGFKSSES